MQSSAHNRSGLAWGDARWAWLACRAILAATMLSGCAAPAAACGAFDRLAGSRTDAAPALQDCLNRLPVGATLSLRAGIYRLRSPIRINRAVQIRTAGIDGGATGCGKAGARACATLLFDPLHAVPNWETPIQISGDDVAFTHLVLKGVGGTASQRARCGRPNERSSGGGIRLTGKRFALRSSAMRDFTCYTALEIRAGATSPVIEDNVIGPNGDHRPGEVWSDGITIHDSQSAVVRNNLFIDNTDVQLIFGGCRDCRVESNRFRHSGGVAGGSFAELMLHSWPDTSGNYSGTIVRGNDIDCGPARRCGFGLMIGAAPWYEGKMTGGTITGNRVRNALVGLNVDGLTGPVEIRANSIANAGGRHRSDCGERNWPAANVAPGSRKLVLGDPTDQAEGSVSTRKCIINR